MSRLDECCALKDVGGKLYTFSHHISKDERDRLKCSSTCAYKHAETAKEQKYCFKPGRIESECKKGNLIIFDCGGPGPTPAPGNEFKVFGTIYFKAIQPLPYTCDANNNFNFTTYVPIGTIIKNITAAVTSYGDSPQCFPYINDNGYGEQKWKFGIMPGDDGLCYVTTIPPQI